MQKMLVVAMLMMVGMTLVACSSRRYVENQPYYDSQYYDSQWQNQPQYTDMQYANPSQQQQGLYSPQSSEQQLRNNPQYQKLYGVVNDAVVAGRGKAILHEVVPVEVVSGVVNDTPEAKAACVNKNTRQTVIFLGNMVREPNQEPECTSGPQKVVKPKKSLKPPQKEIAKPKEDDDCMHNCLGSLGPHERDSWELHRCYEERCKGK